MTITLFAMSDIHGYYPEMTARINQILPGVADGTDQLILLGDYIDYGPRAGRTLQFIYNLQKDHPGNVIVLRGNHEEMFLEWLDTYTGPHAGEPDESGMIPWNDWLMTDPDFQTFRTLVTAPQWEFFTQVMKTLSEDSLNMEAAKMVLESNRELISWLRELPYYYETETQIFVHAGIDEETRDWWKQATPECTFVGKYPATTGTFYKDIIAGHVSTATLAGDRDFHDIFYDGQSHYYIDGTVNASGQIPVLAYEEGKKNYCALLEDGTFCPL